MTVAERFVAEGSSSSTTLYFGPWYRKSPFFEATLRRDAPPTTSTTTCTCRATTTTRSRSTGRC